MANVKTEEENFALSSWGERTTWHNNAEYGYCTGVTYMNNGCIILYYEPKSDKHEFYASARLIHKERVYNLRTHTEVAQLGWVRIVKKWARKIWKK